MATPDTLARSPAAERHLTSLVEEVHALERAVLDAGGWYHATNVFLYGYDDIMSRCPVHGRAEVSTALWRLARNARLTDASHPPVVAIRRRPGDADPQTAGAPREHEVAGDTRAA